MKSHPVPCSFKCGNTVNASDPYTHQRVIGWATAGQSGGSDVVLRERQSQWACRACIEKQKAGIPVNQEALI